jgi:2-iminobutanoate/2-iminopropanoate deaminase
VDIYLALRIAAALLPGERKADRLTLTLTDKTDRLAFVISKFMATKQIIKPAKSPAAVGPYNHAVRVGDLLFCAGQIPIEPATGNLISGDIKAQTERVLQNVKAIMDDQKLTFANVVKSTVFLTNLADFAGMNEIYSKYFTTDFPARSTIQVAALPKGANVEIEVIAHF